MKCINCYKEIRNTLKFCNYCGTMQPVDREAYEREHPELADALPEDIVMKKIKEKEQVAASQAEKASKRPRVATVKATGRRVSPSVSSQGKSPGKVHTVMPKSAQGATGESSSLQPRVKRTTAQPKPKVQPKSKPVVSEPQTQLPKRPLQSPSGNEQTVLSSQMSQSSIPPNIPNIPNAGMSYPAMNAPAVNAPEVPTLPETNIPELNLPNDSSPSQERIAVSQSNQNQTNETVATAPSKAEKILKIAIILLLIAIVVFIILILS